MKVDTENRENWKNGEMKSRKERTNNWMIEKWKRKGREGEQDRKKIEKDEKGGEIPTVVWMVRKDGVAWQKESGNVGWG